MKKEYIVNNNKYIFNGENLELYLIDSNFETELNNEKNKNEKLLNKSKNKLINKIVFNVSNMCNLNCKYCYANGGNYNREDSLMSLNTAKIIINEKFPFDNKNCRSIELYSYALRRVIEIYNESEEKMVILLNNYYSNYLK